MEKADECKAFCFSSKRNKNGTGENKAKFKIGIISVSNLKSICKRNIYRYRKIMYKFPLAERITENIHIFMVLKIHSKVKCLSFKRTSRVNFYL